MYIVFIIDDEPSVLEGLKILIPWDELDFELCGDSSNVTEALLKIEALRPHVIITDICMPHKDGLELIREVRRLEISMEFIILSGYSNFSYAREAMRNQVFHYLLKPVDRDEVISVLQKVKERLDAVFLADYGFTQAEVEAFKSGRNQPGQESGRNSDSQGRWKFVRESFDEELTTALKTMSFPDVKILIDELFAFFESGDIGTVDARIMVNSYVYFILRVAFERNIKLNMILPPEKNGDWGFSELKVYVTDIASKAIHLMLENRRKNSRSNLYEVKAYIENNFDKELSVSFLAEIVFLEAGYLGDTFSRQFGCSINEYQHRLRIEKAIELIRTTGMKLSEIAATVGYKNYNNFFSHFIRITAKKPNQYGKQIAADRSKHVHARSFD